jgi:hypothetical protein
MTRESFRISIVERRTFNKMNKIKFALVILTLFVLSSCVVPPSEQPGLTPLEIQSFQTREFEYPKDDVFPGVVSVFQDLGYIVKSADLNTGYISAESPNNVKQDYDIFIEGRRTVESQMSATAFIESLGKITKVRLNFVSHYKKTTHLHGETPRTDKPVLDANVYTQAFNRIENAIFVRESSKK